MPHSQLLAYKLLFGSILPGYLLVLASLLPAFAQTEIQPQRIPLETIKAHPTSEQTQSDLSKRNQQQNDSDKETTKQNAPTQPVILPPLQKDGNITPQPANPQNQETPATPQYSLPKADQTGQTPAAQAPTADTPEFTAFLEERMATRSLPVKDSIAEKIVIQAMMRILIKRGIMPQAVYNLYSKGLNPLVSRASLANVLIKSQGHNTKLVSEYPTYRDVPKTHWAYAPIEVARERKLLLGNAQGYFKPIDIVTRKEAYLIFAGLLAGTRPTLEQADTILAPFADTKTIPADIRPDIARLVNAQLILPRPAPNNVLDISAPLNFSELVAILSREVEIQDYKRFLLPIDKATLPQLPPGLKFSVVPNGALFKNRLVIGDKLYFSLTEPVTTTLIGETLEVPRGTRVDGELANIVNGAGGQLYQVHFNTIQLPDGKNYQIDGTIGLEFSDKDEEPFIVPGDPYSFTTTVE